MRRFLSVLFVALALAATAAPVTQDPTPSCPPCAQPSGSGR